MPEEAYPKGRRVVKICEYCSKEYTVIPSLAKRSRFCSMRCKGLWVYHKYNNLKRGGGLKKGWMKYKIPKEKLIELYWNKKLSTAQIGKIYNIDDEVIRRYLIVYGIPRRSLSEAHKGRHWRNPKAVKNIKIRPTKPEKKFIEICSKYNLPFKYVGNGSVIINGLNPDFIECNGKKLVVEIFGDYWHRKKPKCPVHLENVRRERYKELGFEMLVIWESELKNLPENIIVDKVMDCLKKHIPD